MLATDLIYDTDQEHLFSVDELPYNAVWISARVYKTLEEGKLLYEVWLYEWDPRSNIEKPTFNKAFESSEEAKEWATEVVREKMPMIHQEKQGLTE